MNTSKRMAMGLVIGLSLLVPAASRADTVLEFRVKEGRGQTATNQAVAIKDGQVMIKAAGGDPDLDLRYSQAEGRVVVVNHRQRTVMTVDEREVERVGRQVRAVQPLLQGVGEQIAKLSPEERRKWQEIVGESVSLDRIAKASEPAEPTRFEPTGTRTVAGIRCQEMRVIQGATPLAEICLAEARALKIPSPDYATIRSLLGLYERLAVKSQALASQFGLLIPVIASGQITGIPIAIRDLSRDGDAGVTLRLIKSARVSPDLMRLPTGYQSKPLTLWP